MPISPNSIDQLAVTLSALLDTPRVLADLRRQVADLTDAVRSMEKNLPSLLVSIDEAAKVLGYSSASVRRWAGAGAIPTLRLGRSWRVDLSKIRGMDPAEIARLAREARSR
jgi:excisionase family DNA binding protein